MSKTPKEKKKCLTAGCETLAESRGLCTKHRNIAAGLIKAGKTTDEALVRAGKILPGNGPRVKLTEAEKASAEAFFLN